MTILAEAQIAALADGAWDALKGRSPSYGPTIYTSVAEDAAYIDGYKTTMRMFPCDACGDPSTGATPVVPSDGAMLRTCTPCWCRWNDLPRRQIALALSRAIKRARRL